MVPDFHGGVLTEPRQWLHCSTGEPESYEKKIGIPFGSGRILHGGIPVPSCPSQAFLDETGPDSMPTCRRFYPYQVEAGGRVGPPKTKGTANENSVLFSDPGSRNVFWRAAFEQGDTLGDIGFHCRKGESMSVCGHPTTGYYPS